MTLLRPRGSLALAILMLFAAFALPRVAAAQTGTIRGTVTDSATGRGVPAVQVTVAGTTRGTATDDQGRYSLGGIPAGSMVVNVQRIGFAAAQRRVTVGSGEPERRFWLGLHVVPAWDGEPAVYVAARGNLEESLGGSKADAAGTCDGLRTTGVKR